MNWETDKAFEYIQNDEVLVNELENKDAEYIRNWLDDDKYFKQYICSLFFQNINFVKLQKDLSIKNYLVELYYHDYCFEINSPFLGETN